jgi:hypothetical protein
MMSDQATACYEKYKHNAALAAKMERQFPDDLGWSCVVRFYATLHLINTYLIGKPSVHFDPISTEHKERRKAMEQCPELRDAPQKYRQLKDLSESVRYDAGFEYRMEDQKNSKSIFDKIVAIVDSKIKKT